MSDLTKILLKQTGFNPHLISPDCRFSRKTQFSANVWLARPTIGCLCQVLASMRPADWKNQLGRQLCQVKVIESPSAICPSDSGTYLDRIASRKSDLLKTSVFAGPIWETESRGAHRRNRCSQKREWPRERIAEKIVNNFLLDIGIEFGPLESPMWPRAAGPACIYTGPPRPKTGWPSAFTLGICPHLQRHSWVPWVYPDTKVYRLSPVPTGPQPKQGVCIKHAKTRCGLHPRV